VKFTLLNYSVLFFSYSQIAEFGLRVTAIAYFSQCQTCCLLKIFSNRICILNWLQTIGAKIYSETKVLHNQASSLFPKTILFSPKLLKSTTFYSQSIGLRIAIIEQIKINSYGPESLPKSI
jgi:hypothetical protein